MICLKPFRFRPLVSHDCDPYAIKVVYDHAPIASYRRWCVAKVGRRVRLLALGGYECCAAWGFPSNPILSGPRRTELMILGQAISRLFRALMALAALVAISGPKKVLNSGPTPYNCPHNGCSSHQTHYVPRHKNNRCINSY